MPHPPDIWTPERGYANTMIPADADNSLPNLVRIALYNLDQWDKVPREDEPDESVRAALDGKTHREKFEDGLARIAMRQGWTEAQCTQVAALKKARPPNALYRVRGGFTSATRGLAPIGIIVSYRPGGAFGGPAEAGVAILGFTDDMAGSACKPLPVPAEGLEDVTEAARAGKLPELRHGGAGV
jgi:hypothetical protein